MPRRTAAGGYDGAALRSRLVAALSGSPGPRLASWHRREIVPASVIRGRRGLPRLYSWRDYHRVRVAVNLLEQGLPSRRLRANLNALEAGFPNWHEIKLIAFEGYVIVTTDGRFDITALEKQGVATEIIRDAALGGRHAPMSEAEMLMHAVHAITHEGPLARLTRFSEWIEMVPGVQGGQPVLKEHRIMTSTIAGYRDSGMSADEIASTLELGVREVSAALHFEHVLHPARAA